MAEKSFTSYVAENKKEYKYLLKFAVNEMTDSMIDQLEDSLHKYGLKQASAFRKTPIMENPLDFPNVKNTPVYICDITMMYPASLDFLRTYICNNLGISPQKLAVYSPNDPRQIETDLFVDRSSPEYREKYKTRLGSDYEDVDADGKRYGETYTTPFLKELEAVRKRREMETVENALSQAGPIDHSTLPGGYYDFNDSKNLPKDDLGLFGRIKKPDLRKAGAV